MVHQASLRFFGVEVPDSLQGSLSELGHDVMTLADLQAQLAKADLAATTREATWPAVGLAVGAIVALSCVPIALIGAAELIVLAGWLPRGGAYLAVAGGVGLVAALTAWLCLRALLRCGSSFQRSKHELTRNVSWVTNVISQGGRLRLRPSPRQ